MMTWENHPHVVLEATWCCCNIATGTTYQIQRLVDKGIIQVQIKLLGSKSSEIFEQASWCVANIAADCRKFQDLLIENGVVELLSFKILNELDFKILKQTNWALSNICRGSSAKNFRMAQFGGPAFIKIIIIVCSSFEKDFEMLYDSLLGLAHICNEAIVNTICDSILLETFKEISLTKNRSVLMPLLKILVYVSNSGDNCHVQKITDHGFLRLFYEMLNDPNQDLRIKKLILNILSNMSLGSDLQISDVIIKEDRFDSLIKFANHENPNVSHFV